MKKKLLVLLIAVMTISLFTLSGCSSGDSDATTANFTDEMKMEYSTDLDEEYGADSVERVGDHEDSIYYAMPDFYNMESTDTLTLLSNFETIQQTNEWSCGVTSMVMVLNWYDMLGDYDEESLAAMREYGTEPGATTLEDIVNIYEEIGGFDVVSTYDYPGDEVWEFMTLDKIQEYLADGTPIIIGWNDWGGHYQVIIGYDNMGTDTQQDDVLVVACPYDTTDHNQDGYIIYPAERFYYNWTMYDFFTSSEKFDVEERDMMFCVATPQE